MCKFYANKLDSLDKKHKFVERHELSQLTPGESLNRPSTSKVIKLTRNEGPGQTGFTGELYQTSTG